MAEFLTFALVAPLASFGDLAVGERRSGFDRPARSAVLGLVAACLGLERSDEEGQAALAAGYGLALLCRSAGRLLADYHTAQVPSSQRGRRFRTRAEELDLPSRELNTVLTRRDYRVGAWHLAALSVREGARWPLAALAEAMERPAFTPYLGRKSCPLGLPLAPIILDAEDAVAALLRREAEGEEASFPVLADSSATSRRVVLDADLIDDEDPRILRTEWRRDEPVSRARWQFGLRAEVVVAP